MGYLGYYFAWMLLSYGLRQPWLLAGVVVLWLLRGFIPRPGALFGAMGRAGRLRTQVELNRANITARRDLATIYLDLLRPRRALALLEEGLALAPDDPELIYLSGIALHRSGQHQLAVERLIRALEKDQRLRHGHPYQVAGDALLALKRWDDAIDAYERFLDFNSSEVATHTQLARAQAGAKDNAAARKSLLAGLHTWHSLHGALKRRHFGAYLKAQWARITVLKDPLAMLVFALLLAGGSYAAKVAYPTVAQLWQPDPQQDAMARLHEGFIRCGSQRTGDFVGKYQAEPELLQGPDLVPRSTSPEELEARQKLLAYEKQSLEGFEILPDRIVSGTRPTQEFCLTKILERKPQLLRAEAVWHEDRDDPGDAAMVTLTLFRGQDETRFSYALFDYPLHPSAVTLTRLP